MPCGSSATHNVMERADILPGVNTTSVHAASDGNCISHNWREAPRGQDFIKKISGTGRPDLSRASAELQSTLGPRIAKVEDDFARTLGWTPNRASRIWETDPSV